ncbi:Sensory transduction protein LytR [bioreactor metagenome]|uniref:Sensory transduction protein LytR n=1 Tax=bioreactor metagenome TaxID=1076179 RepID=A0A645F3U3_9ZZZZ|nr:LytTR family DNA-binding domain-containing protein [Rikenellaceae bacterium]
MNSVLIIEDELLAADYLEGLIREVDGGFEVKAKLGSVKESVDWLEKNKADLIFLDIQLSDGLSFSIFDQVSVSTPIIVTTAYDQYAIKAFDLNSIAYLLKPIRKADLAESLKKLKSLKAAYSIDFENLLSAIQGNKPSYRRRFLIRIADKYCSIETDDIAYFYVSEKGAFFRRYNGYSYPIDISLGTLESMLDPACFFRINRKYVISRNAIVSMTSWSRNRIKVSLKPNVDDESEVIVSIYNVAEFKKWLNT